MTDPKHAIALADEFAHVNVGSGYYSQSIGIAAAMEAAQEILDSDDPAVHAAMLDALTRHGVLTEETAELRAEVDRLRRNRPYCNVMDGPDETCSRHGRTYDEWVKRGDILQTRAQNAEAELDVLRARLEAVETLPDEWEGEADANETHPKECRTLLSAAAELRARLTGEVAP